MVEIFLLLVVFQLKHYLADYKYQNTYMLGKFKPGWGFFLPLLAHSLVNASFTFAICCTYFLISGSYNYNFLLPCGILAGFDLVTHFIMDRIKAGPKYWGKDSDMFQPIFWHHLGIDQMVHHLIHIIIVFMLVRGLFMI